MDLEIYQQQTERLILLHGRILAEATERLLNGKALSPMEEQGVLHSLQVVIENSIGKAKHYLKHLGLKVPVSAYDCFYELWLAKIISEQDLKNWKKVIGLRNAIVHEYMDVDMSIVQDVIKNTYYAFIIGFLSKPINKTR